MNRSFLAILSLLFIIGCSDKNELDGERFSNDSFPENIELYSTVCEAEIVGSPSQIVCADSLLFIVNYRISPMVDILSTSDYKLRRSRINKGRAANEVLMCWDLIVDYPLVTAFDMQSGVILSFDYDEFISSDDLCDYANKISFGKNTVNNLIKFRDGKFIGSDFLRDELVTVYNSNGTVDSTTYSKVPMSFEPNKKLTDIQRLYYYLRDFGYSNTREMVVVYYNNKHIIELYDKNLKFHKRMIGPLREELDSEVDERFFTYKGVDFTSEYIYLLYGGMEMKENAEEVNSVIYKFDYNGVPISRYSLDRVVNCFSISESQRLIYAISSTCDDVHLLKYNL